MFDSALRAIYSTLAPAGVNARLSTLIYHRALAEPVPMLPYGAERCAVRAAHALGAASL